MAALKWCITLCFVGITSLSGQDATTVISRLTNCRPQELQVATARLQKGIIDGAWAKTLARRPLPVPPEYLRNLADMAEACESGAASTSAILQDLETKINDCRKFGMARLVPIRVETLHASGLVREWEVFYRWDSGSSSPNIAELRAPGLSTTSLKLPPGLYIFRAQQGQRASDKVRIPVSGMAQVVVQIKVP
ncbi:MAG TPA: hypothetical protein VHC72_04790 [Bryobacteraceae bacterium]|nr:hypothetical protein [Bryobacteraceae bacterium]